MKERTFISPLMQHAMQYIMITEQWRRILIIFIPYNTGKQLHSQVTMFENYIALGKNETIYHVVIMLYFKSNSFALLHVENYRRQTFDFH